MFVVDILLKVCQTTRVLSCLHKKTKFDILTRSLNLLNFLNGVIHLPFLELSIIIFRDIKISQ